MANKKITQLDALTSAAAAEGDVLPIVDLDADQTKKIQLGDLKSGSFVGTSTGLAGSPSITVTNVNAASGAYSLNTNGTISMATASIGGGIFTSASLAAGGGGGGSAFPFTGSAGITGSINLIGAITASSDISSSTNVFGDRINAASYVGTPQINNLTGIELLANGGSILITGSGEVGIKTTDATTGGVDISSAKDFTNTVGGAYHLTATGGIRITGSGGGTHPIELDAGLEDGVFVRGGNAGINLISATNTNINSTGNTIIDSTGNIEISGSGARGVRISSSKFNIEGEQTSEIRMHNNANLDIFGSPLGDMSLQPGFGRTLTISGEAANFTADVSNILLKDDSLAEQFQISASGMHIISETQFFQFVNNLPTTEPTITGQLWISGSGYGSASGSKYIMIKQ